MGMTVPQVLVEAGADLSVRDNFGETPRQVIKQMSSKSLEAAAMLRFLDDHASGRTYARDRPCSCAACGKEPSATGKRLQVCAGCRSVSYCSKQCQREHWKNGHKAECERLRHPQRVRAARANGRKKK